VGRFLTRQERKLLEKERRRGERAKLAPTTQDDTESDYRPQELAKSTWAACIRLRPCGNYGGTGQARVRNQPARLSAVALAKVKVPQLSPIPKFIDTTEAIDELPCYDSFEPAPDDF
jgi:hypothetical protein